MFDISEKLIVGQSYEIYGVTPISWEDSSWKYIFGWWWTSHQSSADKGLRLFRFCIMPWKEEREPTIKLCMIDVVQKFIRIQSFGQNWWWANGIRVEYLPRIHHIAALPQDWAEHQRNLLNGSSSCRCSTTSHGDLSTTRKTASQMLNTSLSMQRDSEQDNGHSSDLDRRKSGTLLVKTVHMENGTE